MTRIPLPLLILTVLSGGGLPAISVSPSSWDFGSTPVGTPPTKEFTIENTGTATLEITLPITIEGAEASAFTVTAQPGVSSLAPGASTTFTVQADADVIDSFDADISIVSNAAGSPTLVAISVVVAQTHAQKILATAASDIIGMWQLNETSGTVATDSSGNGRNGVHSNVALNALKFADGSVAPEYNGSTSLTNLYGTSLRDAFNGAEGTLVIAFRATTGNLWTDDITEYLFRFRVDANNFILARTSASDDTLTIQRAGGGTTETISLITHDMSWNVLALRWSQTDDFFRVDFNGVEVATATGLGVWAGVLNSTTTVLAAATSTATTPGRFALRNVAIWDIPLTDEQVEDLAIIPILNPDFETISSTVLWGSEVADDDWQGRAVLEATGAGAWLSAYRVGSQHTPDTNSRIYMRFSEDEGANWTDENIFTDDEACVGLPLVEQVVGKSLTELQLIPCPNGDLLALSYERAGGGTSQWRSEDNGKTWSYEGVINSDTTLVAFEDYTIVGSTIYMVCRVDPGSDFAHPHYLALYESDDNGETWTKTSDIETTLDCNEAGLVAVDANNFTVIVRDDADRDTFVYYSSDTGASWSARASIGKQLGILQRPRIKKFGSTIYLVGRDVRHTTIQATVIYSSADGAIWSIPYAPTLAIEDDETGYCDLLQRENGDLYMQTYVGTLGQADVVDAVIRASA